MIGGTDEAIYAVIKTALGKMKIDFSEAARAPDTMAVYRVMLKMARSEDFPRDASAADMETVAVDLLEMSQWGDIEVGVSQSRATWTGLRNTTWNSLLRTETVADDAAVGAGKIVS